MIAPLGTPERIMVVTCPAKWAMSAGLMAGLNKVRGLRYTRPGLIPLRRNSARNLGVSGLGFSTNFTPYG